MAGLASSAAEKWVEFHAARPVYGALMAAAVVITLPLVVFFLFAQRLFIEGMTMSGLKG